MHADAAGYGRIDAAVERLGRWTAGRTSRRGFLGTAGRAAVVVAGGPALLAAMAGPANARVCGQSGSSPLCATFDCNATWGWCWYATGCCAGGRLKKICDCCAANTPNLRGYCPSGLRVRCVVESCGQDPRLQTVALHRIAGNNPIGGALAVSRARFRGRVPIAVVGDAESALFAACAASLGRVVDGPVLLTSRGGLNSGVADELGRLRVEFVKVVGSRLDPAVDDALRRRGLHVERIGTSGRADAFSAQVAVWSRSMTGSRTVVVVMPDVPAAAVASAAAFAHALRRPLLLATGDQMRPGLEHPRAARTTYVVTTNARDADAFPGGRAIAAGSASALAARIADTGVGLGVPADTIMLAARTAGLAAAGAATMPLPLLLYAPGSMAGARDWLFARRAGIRAAYAVGSREVFTTAAQYELQSILNRFETHLLIGEAGQGLPVIPQPPEERPIGMARP